MSPIITPTLPTIGQPNVTEDVDARNTLQALVDLVNGNIDAANILNGAITSAELGDIGHGDLMQPGVLLDAHGKVTAAGSMGLAVAAGTAWVRDASALMQRMRITGITVTVPTAHATLPRVDQVIATLTTPGAAATVSVLQGTPTTGAQVSDPNAGFYRAGAASLPTGAIRLADVIVGAAVGSIVTGNIVDRRQWAKGLARYVYNLGTDASGNFSSGPWRFEASGERMVEIDVNAYISPGTTGLFGQLTAVINSNVPAATWDNPVGNLASPVGGNAFKAPFRFRFVPAAGSNLLTLGFVQSGASVTFVRSTSSLKITELSLNGTNE
jgi:hypothetical protein